MAEPEAAGAEPWRADWRAWLAENGILYPTQTDRQAFVGGWDAEHARAERLADVIQDAIPRIHSGLNGVSFEDCDGSWCQQARAALAGDAPGRGEG